MVDGDVAYWRRMAEEYKKSLETTQEELSEFQTQSHELEKELELQLEQSEKKVIELQSRVQKLESERDTLTVRLEETQRESQRQSERLSKELATTGADLRRLQSHNRELEQTNDDLERANRNVSAMLEEFERQLNETLERNALLESELDEKEKLNECIQRLREESRDLRQEIAARQLRHQHSVPAYHNQSGGNGVIASPGEKVPVSPTTGRVSALNIVGDLLRKVGALESKLASCRKVPSSDVPSEAPQAKQAHLA